MSAIFNKVFHVILHFLLHTVNPIKPYAKENNKLSGTISFAFVIAIICLCKHSWVTGIAVLGIIMFGALFMISFMIQKSKKRNS